MLLLGAAMATSIVAVNLIVPDVPVLKVLLCVSILYAFASIAKYITYKAAEWMLKMRLKTSKIQT